MSKVSTSEKIKSLHIYGYKRWPLFLFIEWIISHNMDEYEKYPSLMEWAKNGGWGKYVE